MQKTFQSKILIFFSQNKTLELVPLCISDLSDSGHALYQYVTPVRIDEEMTIASVVKALGDWMVTGESPQIFSPVPVSLLITYHKNEEWFYFNTFNIFKRFINSRRSKKVPSIQQQKYLSS